MTVKALRPLLATTASALAIGSFALAGAPVAFAAPVPGDNGDVKIHKVGTPTDDPRNEPKVCHFYLAAFNFDTLQEVDWEIAPQPPKADSPTLSGHIVLNSGAGRTPQNEDQYLELPNGMYKLTWTFEGEHGAGKHKVFKVDCPSGGPGGGNNGGGNNGGGNNGGSTGGHGHHKPPHGPVGAGGGGAADTTAPADDSAAFGVGSAIAAGLAGTAGLILIRRSRRRNDGAA
ncbi:hypothetical protein ACFYU9_27780 [Streptomyces sp. NPDC004327]|uniref:hypothetical protein n=1 Tax=unclassified Streptomyces TaxID=2593676 RepID=UPI00368199E2